MADDGIVVPKGASLRLTNLRIGWGPKGPEVGPATVELSLHMAPVWIEIALGHLVDSEEHRLRRLAAAKDDKASSSAEGEFVAAMQAIVAAATALDAFYALIKPLAGISEEMSATWRVKGTARYKQVAEVLRRGFALQPKPSDRLRQMLKEIYRFRDWAVHPPAGFSLPVQHPESGTGVEWRFVAFRFDNARAAVRSALGCIALLSWSVRADAPEALLDASKATVELTNRLVQRWRQRYGPLTDDEKFESTGRDELTPTRGSNDVT